MFHKHPTISLLIISLISAASENDAIGKDGVMPWNLPDEKQYFRDTTEGKPVIMGRRTWESLPEGRRPLPGRPNIVVTHQHDFKAALAIVVNSLEEGIKRATVMADEVFVIGGQQLYEQALPIADRLYLTRVHTDIEGADAFFPAVDFQDWREVSRTKHPKNDRHAFAFTQMVFERLNRPR